VRESLRALGKLTSAHALHARLAEEGKAVGLSAVYRTLTLMAGSGEASVLHADKGEALYRSCSTGGA
jgi:Fur family transcriptional regulator, ferric uptake regulator